MDFDIYFNSDTFKHGVSEADIRKAFDTAIYDGFLDKPSDDDARTNTCSSDSTAMRIPLKYCTIL